MPPQEKVGMDAYMKANPYKTKIPKGRTLQKGEIDTLMATAPKSPRIYLSQYFFLLCSVNNRYRNDGYQEQPRAILLQVFLLFLVTS